MYIDGNNDGVAGTLDSNFNEAVIVRGGNLHFATNGDFGIAEYVESEAGAVGVDAGVVNNAAFFGLLNNDEQYGGGRSRFAQSGQIRSRRIDAR